MRIGLIIYGSLNQVSGGYLYDRKLVHHLEAQGDTVEIISIPWETYTKHFKHNFSTELLKRIVNGNFDLLLQDELNHPSLVWLNRQIKKATHLPIISIVHHLRSKEKSLPPQQMLYQRIEHSYLQTVDGFVYNSYTTRHSVEELLGVRKPNIVAYPAADHVELPPKNPTRFDQNTLRICYIGNVIPRKGLHTLLLACTYLNDLPIMLRAVGSLTNNPDYANLIREQISSIGSSHQIRLLDRLSDTHLAEQLIWADVLVMPSTYEGFGIVYLEAMAAGLPVLATLSGAAHEVVIHGKNGFLLPPNDASAFAGYLRLLHNDRQQLATMAQAARCAFDKHPTWAESMQQVRCFLQTVTR